jgi:hypothetical protein
VDAGDVVRLQIGFQPVAVLWTGFFLTGGSLAYLFLHFSLEKLATSAWHVNTQQKMA